ncbi:MAG TPA: lysophospholipid acyltransferase family protein [Thermoanaerobaculia bacterium]|nr:lysophospholipid acyltransferase family protein [Thermoanaerobaculia bacterium]
MSRDIAILSLLGAGFIRGLAASVRRRYHGDELVRQWEQRGEHFILAFWHRHMLLMPYGYRGRRMTVLSSHSRDGEIMVRTLARLGIDTCRGSTTRGGAAGLRGLLRMAAEGSDLGFTPDGPRGPAGEVQQGVIIAAAMSGFPIQPAALAATRARRLGSWDRMVVPLPFSTVHYVYGEPLYVERRADPAAAAAELKRRLDAAEAEAERLAGRSGGGSE